MTAEPLALERLTQWSASALVPKPVAPALVDAAHADRVEVGFEFDKGWRPVRVAVERIRLLDDGMELVLGGLPESVFDLSNSPRLGVAPETGRLHSVVVSSTVIGWSPPGVEPKTIVIAEVDEDSGWRTRSMVLSCGVLARSCDPHLGLVGAGFDGAVPLTWVFASEAAPRPLWDVLTEALAHRPWWSPRDFESAIAVSGPDFDEVWQQIGALRRGAGF